jgi:hypothetical protein
MTSDDEQLANLLPALCLPDDRSDWPTWLEQQVMGYNLPKLCKQLVTLGGKHPPQLTLSELLGNQRDPVLQQGLGGPLSAQQIQRLIQNPGLLLELQYLILEEGGDYWTQVRPTPDVARSLETVRSKVLSQIRSNTEPSSAVDQALNPVLSRATEGGSTSDLRRAESPENKTKREGSWYWVGAILATAAAILLVVMNPFQQPQDQGEFFAAAELRAPAETVDATLSRIADRIEKDWNQKPVTDNASLLNRLITFRDSCDHLIDGRLDASLQGLSDAKLTDLKERCKKWKGQAETMIADLQGESPPENLKDKADELMGRLKKILRNPDELGKPKPV